MSDKSTVDSYNKIAKEFHQRNSVSIYNEEYNFFSTLFGHNRKVLEIGCGTGRDAQGLIDLGFTYTGVDVSEGMLAVAREVVPAGEFQTGDFYALDFPDATFDGFWAAASFLHVPKSEIDKVIQEAKRVLKASGVGFISLKQKTSMDEGYIEEEKLGGIKRYFAFYDEEEFSKILSRNGFDIIKLTKQVEKDGTQWLCYFIRASK